MQILQDLEFQDNFSREFEVIKSLKHLLMYDLNVSKHLSQEAAIDME